MVELSLRRDEDIVVKAIETVLNKYGADSNISDLLYSGGKSEIAIVFSVFCGRLDYHLRQLTAISRAKALVSFHHLSLTVLEDLRKLLFTELGVASVAALTRQSVNWQLFNILAEEAASKFNIVQHDATPQVAMGLEEESTVRYASGYVAMKLMKEFVKDTEHAAQFVECLSHMAVEGQENDFYSYTRQWVKSVDRGGIFHINTSSFFFFRALEVATQTLLPHHLSNPQNSADGLKQKISEDEDVQFYWSMVSIDIPNEVAATELL